MAQRKHADPHDYLSVSIPISLIEKLRAHCHDSLTGKPKHGQQSKIIQALLNQYLAKSGVTIIPPAGNTLDTFEVSVMRPNQMTPAQSKDLLEYVLVEGRATLAAAISHDDLRYSALTTPPLIRYQLPEIL